MTTYESSALFGSDGDGGTEMVVTEMVVTEMVVTEMVVTEMVVTEMVVTEMVVTEMVVTEMVVTQFVQNLQRQGLEERQRRQHSVDSAAPEQQFLAESYKRRGWTKRRTKCLRKWSSRRRR